MRIVADEGIVAVDSYFSAFGELITLPGRQISAADVRDADALLVRSITRVDRALLEHSRVRFVATATSGTDHLDMEWLRQAGIAVHDAAGCNANAVLEYVLTALASLKHMALFDKAKPTVGIVGAGQVGGRLAQLCRQIGFPCVVTDPFLTREQQESLQAMGVELSDLQTVLTADIVSLHTPLTRTVPHPTWHLLNHETLDMLQDDAVLINASRGEVVDTRALIEFLKKKRSIRTVFDVWENEPRVDPDLCARVDIATPHIAGYSIQAKLAASLANYRSFVQFFGFQADLGLADAAALDVMTIPVRTLSRKSLYGMNQESVAALIAAFPLPALSREFKLAVASGQGERQFDDMRAHLARRHEFLHA
ncbi:MAG: 4-phosphoerythronate dehydrogenase [Pseudomonadales bacterium]|nr:4-phosphoerythronate dehydrogenase [Pseudomonadales bacterium]